MIEEIIADANDKMSKAVARAQLEFASVRTGRATPALVERVVVDYYGTETQLKQLAGFSVPEARLLVIQPYDKGAIGAIEKAIQNADLGMNPSNDGQVIRLSVPQLTAERRKEMVKLTKTMGEDGKVAIRNLRRTCRHDLEALEKDGQISADELERAEKELEKITAGYVSAVDTALEQKERELLEV